MEPAHAIRAEGTIPNWEWGTSQRERSLDLFELGPFVDTSTVGLTRWDVDRIPTL